MHAEAQHRCSPPPPPRLLCCYAITSPRAASRRALRDSPWLGKRNQGRAPRVPGPFWRARPAIDPEQRREKSGDAKGRHAREEEETKYTWREGKKREEGRCANTQKAPWSDLWRPETGCWAQPRLALPADISHRLSGLAPLILGSIWPRVCRKMPDTFASFLTQIVVI